MKTKDLIIAKRSTFLITALCIGAFIGSQSLMVEPPESIVTLLNTVNSTLMYVGIFLLVMFWLGHVLGKKE